MPGMDVSGIGHSWLVLPILQGWLLFAPGILIVYRQSQLVKTKIDQWRLKYPKVEMIYHYVHAVEKVFLLSANKRLQRLKDLFVSSDAEKVARCRCETCLMQ